MSLADIQLAEMDDRKREALIDVIARRQMHRERDTAGTRNRLRCLEVDLRHVDDFLYERDLDLNMLCEAVRAAWNADDVTQLDYLLKACGLERLCRRCACDLMAGAVCFAGNTIDKRAAFVCANCSYEYQRLCRLVAHR